MVSLAPRPSLRRGNRLVPFRDIQAGTFPDPQVRRVAGELDEQLLALLPVGSEVGDCQCFQTEAARFRVTALQPLDQMGPALRSQDLECDGCPAYRLAVFVFQSLSPALRR